VAARVGEGAVGEGGSARVGERERVGAGRRERGRRDKP